MTEKNDALNREIRRLREIVEFLIIIVFGMIALEILFIISLTGIGVWFRRIILTLLAIIGLPFVIRDMRRKKLE